MTDQTLTENLLDTAIAIARAQAEQITVLPAHHRDLPPTVEHVAPITGNPYHDAVTWTTRDGMAAALLHAAKLARTAPGVAYDLRVIAAMLLHLDAENRDPHHGDWQADWSPDQGLDARCPECDSKEVSTSSTHWGWLECTYCGCFGEDRP